MPLDDQDATLCRLRRAVYRRALRQVRASLAACSVEQIMKAVEAETPLGTIACIVSSAPLAGMDIGPSAIKKR